VQFPFQIVCGRNHEFTVHFNVIQNIANKTSLDIPFIKEGWKREEAW
jgi:hypothetical protein